MDKKIITSVFLCLVSVSVMATTRDITKLVTTEETTLSETADGVENVKNTPHLQGIYISNNKKRALIDNIWFSEKDSMYDLKVLKIYKQQVLVSINKQQSILKLK